MIRSLTTLSLLLAFGVVAAAEQPAPAQKVHEERPVLTSFGELRGGGNAFNPVYTFQPIPAKQRIARKAQEPEKAKPAQPATPTHTPGEVQEL